MEVTINYLSTCIKLIDNSSIVSLGWYIPVYGETLEVIVELFDEIAQEMDRQVDRWGQQNHGPHRWLAILMEEVGEVAKEALESSVGSGRLHKIPNTHDYHEIVLVRDTAEAGMREELIQVAAVAMSWLECIDRRG